MSTRNVVVLLTVGWLLAAAALWWAGSWSARVHRYDDCTYVAHIGPQPFWACPAGEPEPKPSRGGRDL